MDNNILISAVITTKNASDFIRLCIEALKKQTYKNIEIIVVDNFSTDGTLDIAKELGAIVYSKGPERSAQRNYGAEMSKGEFVCFIDVDMIFSENLIYECVEASKDKEVFGMYIHEKIYGKTFFNRVRDFEESFYRKTPIDAVRIVKRDVFLNIGGFDLSLNGPEDWDLDRRIRALGKTAYIEAIFEHYENQTLKEYLKRKSYYASTFDKYFEKWGFDETTKKQFGLFYRYFIVFFENGKWKKLIRHPIYALSMYFVKSLVGVVYLLSRFNISQKKNVYE